MRFLKRGSKRKIVRIAPTLTKLTGTFACGNKETINAVVDRYFQLAKEHIIDGGEWTFGDAFSICIHKKNVRNKQLRNPITGALNINIRRPGEKNNFVAYGDVIKERNYKFKPSDELKAELNEILFNTNKEYRYAPTR